MERKNKIGISFDASYFAQIFIHTAGAYLNKPINKTNNKYLANLGTVPPDERFGQLVLELENANSESERKKIIRKQNQQRLSAVLFFLEFSSFVSPLFST